FSCCIQTKSRISVSICTRSQTCAYPNPYLQKKVDKFFHFAFCSKPTTKKYLFDDRSKGFSKLLLVLAGYKNAFWDDVFARVQKFVPDDFDICIISSGVNDPALRKIAEKDNWSYLSCKRNNINLTQSTAISLFHKAE